MHAIASVDVTRSVRDSVGGFSWVITFNGVDGDLSRLRIQQATGNPVLSTSGEVNLTVCSGGDEQACVDGSFISGSFLLSADGGNTTALVASNASNVELETAFASFGETVSVSVPQRRPALGAGWTGGYAWRVTFTSHPGDFNDSLLIVEAADAATFATNGFADAAPLSSGAPRNGSAVRDAQVTINPVVPQQGSSIGGTFSLVFGAMRTDPIDLGPEFPIDADAVGDRIQTALQMLNETDAATGAVVSAIPSVNVSV